ncbi:unnamed protein product [Somion occarium]|uniref:Uncharacterized protein n=1 Tax=Somion occarium TaxID=3059160 RepID=A0ABP1CIL9_9APHY
MFNGYGPLQHPPFGVSVPASGQGQLTHPLMLQPNSYNLNLATAQPQIQPTFTLNTTTGNSTGVSMLGSSWPMSNIGSSGPISSAEELIMIAALHKSESNSEVTYRDALDTLHGLCGRPAAVWKDHYLQHKHRLDDLVSRFVDRKGDNACSTRPERDTTRSACRHPTTVGSNHHEPSNRDDTDTGTITRPKHVTISEVRPSVHRSDALRTSKPTRPVSSASRPSVRPRVYVKPPNGDSGGGSASRDRGRASHHGREQRVKKVRKDNHRDLSQKLRMPPTPSRSPTPPTRVVASHYGRGNLFTPEDREYFIKSVQWQLQHNPRMTRAELCSDIAEKVPHHSYGSWLSEWRNYRDLLNRLKEKASEEHEENDSDTTTSHTDESDYSTDDPDEETIYISSDTDSDTDSDLDSILDGATPEEDESNLGQSGDAWTNAEVRTMARYIASATVWNTAVPTQRSQWIDFFRKYPQRSDKAWLESYRRYNSVINSLVRKYKKMNASNAVKIEEPEEISVREVLAIDEDDDYEHASDERGSSTTIATQPRVAGSPVTLTFPSEDGASAISRLASIRALKRPRVDDGEIEVGVSKRQKENATK